MRESEPSGYFSQSLQLHGAKNRDILTRYSP